MSRSKVESFYPFHTIGYGTLTEPATFTTYCFYPDCPTHKYPAEKIEASENIKQNMALVEGTKRWDNSNYSRIPYQGTWSDLSQPLYTSNIRSLDNNYLHYSTAVAPIGEN